ncbi:CK1 family protein kinase [Histomonas meleagridis]|uniref:CK1 family protein kinase n=1 Tax=Histomonas meleagridis TaxID=135588 RepID=UPI003559B3B9|nr:CK1 family protein kinase [Histomonas meleagridis]KAH0805896.1 CK1 family protein kinase [Histomonas meleagridis]
MFAHRTSSRASRKTHDPGDTIADYVIVKLIGQGGYGDIYTVQKDESEEIYAMKLESITAEKQGLETEVAILSQVQDSEFFAKLYETGQTESERYLVMELLGPSVSNTRRQTPSHSLSLGTTLRIGIFMVQCIEDFHKHGFIHRDIKSGNFLLRYGHQNPLALIDFGLSRKFIDPQTNEPFPERKKCGFRGTAKYASVYVHESRDQCRRDDLISWCYSLVELVEGRLPWSTIHDNEQVHRAKARMSPKSLFKRFPQEFQEIYRYINTLTFTSVPHYEYIIQLILQSLVNMNFDLFSRYDWEYFKKEQIERYSPIPKLPKASELVLPETQSIASKDDTNHSNCACKLL